LITFRSAAITASLSSSVRSSIVIKAVLTAGDWSKQQKAARWAA
jgi:hypothetical protein